MISIILPQWVLSIGKIPSFVIQVLSSNAAIILTAFATAESHHSSLKFIVIDG